MKRPVVEWRHCASLAEWPKGWGMSKSQSKYDLIWDGDAATLDWNHLDQTIPQGYGFYGCLRAFVGDLEIGHVTLSWSQHAIGHPKRLLINGYSIFDPKKRNGGYGKDFNDEPKWDDRTQWKSRADLGKAKAYVEKFFFDIVDKAKLVAQ